MRGSNSSSKSIDKFEMIEILNQSVKSINNSQRKIIEPKQNKEKPINKKVSEVLGHPEHTAFLKYYEENIKLKKQLDDKKSYIQQLKKKLENQMNMNKTNNPYQALNQLKQQVKKPGVPRGQKAGKSFYNTMTGAGQTKKVQNLLQIIQHYKSKLLLADQQAATLRQQKTLLEQDITIKQKVRNQSVVSKKDYRVDEELGDKLKRKNADYQMQKERNNFMDAEIRRLQAKVRSLQINKDEVQDLKVQNRILEERLMKMTLLNDTSEGFDRRAIQDKAKELDSKLKSTVDKYNRLKDQKMKIQVDITLQSKKIIEMQHQIQQLSAQNLKLKKNQINDPIIQRLIKNKQLLVRVIGEMQTPQSIVGKQSLKEYQTAHKLILQKQQLARQLIETKSKIKNMQQTWKQKQTLNQIQKEEIMNQVNMMPSKQKSARFTSAQGVPYDGDISMFTDTKIGQATGVNFFDIYLGQMNLMQTIVRSSVGLVNTTNPLIMATVDFYNFETKHTKLIQGLASNFNTQFTFRIAQDQFFYKFMTKGSLKIDIYASEGVKNHLLGSVQVPLKQLFLKNKPNISPVVNSSAPILINHKVVGTIHFDMRMRLPIYEQASKVLSASMIANEQQPQAQKRKIVIQVEEGSGFNSKSNLFVYYPFRFQDLYTSTCRGPQPKWNHTKLIEVIFNQDFKNYLKKNQLQFTIFDDNAVLYDEKDSDVVGSGSIPLMSLVDTLSLNKPIREKVQIKKNGVTVGVIDVKVFWYEVKSKADNKQIKKQQQLLDTLHNDVKKYIKGNNRTWTDQFKRIDDNGTGFISFEEFQIWFTKVKQSHRYSQQLVSDYYNTFKQPLNLINWQNRMNKLSQEQKRPQDMFSELGMINQFLHKNSQKIVQQMSLKDYMKGRQPLQVTLDIDKDGNGIITKKELMHYMKEHDIVLDQNQIQGDQVKLHEFLKKYCH